MPTNPKQRRFVVSDLGFGFAVHDAGSPQDYEFPAGREKKHPSTNQLNSRRVEICTTRVQAQRIADELNERYEREGHGG